MLAVNGILIFVEATEKGAIGAGTKVNKIACGGKGQKEVVNGGEDFVRGVLTKKRVRQAQEEETHEGKRLVGEKKHIDRGWRVAKHQADQD